MSPQPHRHVHRFGEWVDVLTYIIHGYRARFAAAVLFGLLTNIFITAANPLALKYLFDEGIIRGNFRRFALLSVGFMLLFTVWRIAVYVYRIHVQNLKNTVFSGLSARMLAKFYRLPYSEVLRRDRGYFLSRIYDEVSQTAPLVMDTTFSLINSLVMLATALVIATAISHRATVTVLIAVPIVYALSRRYAGRIRKESVTEKEEEAKVRGVLERAVGSYKPARVFGLQPRASRTFQAQIDTFINAFAARFRSSTRYETVSGILMSYVENIAIVSAGYEMLMGRMTFGGFMGFMSAFWGVMGAVRGLFGRLPDLSRATGMAERLREFEAVDEAMTGIRYSEAVLLDRVAFAYDGHHVLSDFALSLNPGERLLVLGPNGSGKSTLAHLVTGLLQPSTGSMSTLPLERVSAIVPPFEFIPGTVRDNLSFATPSQVQRVDELVLALGLSACLDRDPSELSAGQRKRLEILMVLSKPADLYLLDEPLAGVDVASKLELMNAIFETTRGHMLIVIMHGDDQFHGRFDRILDLAQPREWTAVRQAV